MKKLVSCQVNNKIIYSKPNNLPPIKPGPAMIPGPPTYPVETNGAPRPTLPTPRPHPRPYQNKQNKRLIISFLNHYLNYLENQLPPQPPRPTPP